MRCSGRLLLLAVVASTAGCCDGREQPQQQQQQQYRVAYVEEFKAVNLPDAPRTLRTNAAATASWAADAAARGADVLLMPEYGMPGFVNTTGAASKRDAWYPYLLELRDEWLDKVLCGDDAGSAAAAAAAVAGPDPAKTALSLELLTRLSCAARSARTAVVIDMLEVVYLPAAGTSARRSALRSDEPPQHPPAPRLQYNTAVVFDAAGTLLRRARKFNLFGEAEYLDTPVTCETAAPFPVRGVPVCVMVCADLIYAFPFSRHWDGGRRSRDFLLPVAWSNEMADMEVLAYAQGWSERYRVNVVVANHRRVGRESGTGAFASGAAVAAYYDVRAGLSPHLRVVDMTSPPASAADTAVAADVVPTAAPAAAPAAAPQASQPQTASAWRFELLVRSSASSAASARVCSGGVCCAVRAAPGLLPAGSAQGWYAAGVADGMELAGDSTWGVAACGVFFVPAGAARPSTVYGRPSGRGNGMVLGDVTVAMSARGEGTVLPTQASYPDVVLTAAGPVDTQLPSAAGKSHTIAWNATHAVLSLRQHNSSKGSDDVFVSCATVYGRVFARDKLAYNCH